MKRLTFLVVFCLATLFSFAQNTEVKVIIKDKVSSKQSGTVAGTVASNVTDADGNIIISQGTAVQIPVMSKESSELGKPGKISIDRASISLENGEKINLVTMARFEGKDRQDATIGLTVAGFLVTGPVGALFLLINGKEAEIPAGTQLTFLID